MFGSILSLLLLNLAISYGLNTPPNYCSNRAVTELNELSSKMKLSSDYKLEGTLTDWIKKTTAYFAETSIKDAKAISLDGRETSSRLVQLDKQYYDVNSTHCLPNADPNPYSISKDLLSLFNVTKATSISSLINTVIDFSTKNKGILNDTDVVAGIEGVLWVSCMNGTDQKPVLQLEVVYSGPGSFTPTSAAFSNPQLMFIRISQLNSNGTVVESISFSIDKRTDIKNSQTAFQIPNGVLCEGRNATPLTGITYPDPVNLLVQVNDTNNYELFYSQSQQLAIVQTKGVKKDDAIPFFNVTASSDGSIFIHDFYSGYEYTLSSSSCVGLKAISMNSTEVTQNPADNKFVMKDLNDSMIQSAEWQKYDKDGKIVYRTRSGSDEIKELEKSDGKIQISTYSKGVLLSKSIITSLTTKATPNVFSLVRDCFARQGSDYYRFTINNKKMSDVLDVGEEEVTKSLAEALTGVALVNKYRIKASYSDNGQQSLDVVFRVAVKNDHACLETGFDRAHENTTEQFEEKLNKTLKGNNWTFKVNTNDWVVSKGSMSLYPVPISPPGPAPFQGYTGGAMFILGLFSLVFGVSIGAGVLFFISRRQRISTLAYQVFE